MIIDYIVKLFQKIKSSEKSEGKYTISKAFQAGFSGRIGSGCT
jgi:hypothetical protein